MDILGGWYTNFIYVGLAAIAIAVIFAIAYVRKGRYDREASFGIKCEVWLPSGRPITRVVPQSNDGWVDLGKLGHYKLATPRRFCKCGHDESSHGYSEKVKGVKCSFCDCTEFKEERIIPAIRRWARYPETPFLGLKALQTWIRTESWWLNNPEPITPNENRTRVTAVDAMVHTREIEGQSTAIQMQQLEAQQKDLMNAIANQPSKTVVYILLIANLAVTIISIVRAFPVGAP